MTDTVVSLMSIVDYFVNISSQFESNHLFNTLGVKSHGTITFNYTPSNKANFIRIPPDTSAIDVKDFLIRQCCDKRPSLVISITGSAKEYNMKSKLFQIFRKGLLKVVRTTDVWIITDGINTSMTKLIGEIIRTNPDSSRPIHLIGIATWGYISGVDQLDIHGTNVNYTKPRNIQKDEASLESNHTKFIFIDDETRNKFGSEIEFRTRFEKAIAGESFSLENTTIRRQHSSQDWNVNDSIPVVLLVIEGGLETIKIVHETIIQNNIPVVLFEGTGGCCDLFAKAYHLYNEYYYKTDISDRTIIDPEFSPEQKEQIKNRLRERLKIHNHEITQTISNDNIEIDYFELIYECIEKRKIFLNIINFNSHNLIEPDMDLAILQALLNATSGNDSSKTTIEQKREQLYLALEWNRVDIVKNFIMKDDRDWKLVDLNDLFEMALVRNQINFVQLFLDHDFSLVDLFDNHDKLVTLYKNENFNLIQDLNNPLRSIYTNIIKPLTGDFFEIDPVFNRKEVSSDIELDDEICSCCTIAYLRKPSIRPNDSMQSIASKRSNINHMDIDKELFLWSIITGKQDLALLFWSRGKNKICAALIATLLYKIKARKDKDPSYNVWADEFQILAVQILEKFYRTDPCACTKAIIRQIPEFGNATWLHLAVMVESKQFIAQRAVQHVLNDIWYGHIDHTEDTRLIIFSTIMLWYSGFLHYHKEMVERTEQFPLKCFNSHHSSSFIHHDTLRLKHQMNKTADKARMRLIQDKEEEEETIRVIGARHWEKTKTSVNQYLKNILMFLHAPYVKYLYNLYSHIIFLILFSYVILCDFFPLYGLQSNKCLANSNVNIDLDIRKESLKKTNNSQSFSYNLHHHKRLATTEIILIVWIFALFCDEIRQIFEIELKSIHSKILAYSSVFWNKLDFLALSLFFIGFILRIWPTTRCFCAARIVLAVDLSLWYIRTLDMFAAIKRLGPKLVMIGEMIHDLKFFMLMLTVFVLAFGVPTYSLVYGVEKFTWHLPRAIINLAYWQIFGELEALDEIEKNYEISGYVMFILLIAYMTVASVLLISLLIAMFSNTFDRLHMDADCIWKFQYYSLVSYYLSRPSLPAPLVIIIHFWRLIVYFLSTYIKLPWFRRKYRKHQNRSKLHIVANYELTRKIESIEDALGNEIYYYFLKTDRKMVDYDIDFDEDRVYSPQEIMLNKVKKLENQVQLIQNQQINMFEYLECLMNGIKKIGGDDIEMPKRYHTVSDISCM
ncbi:unnamed protein product [Rotaria sordida]|uniref:Transient receptor potential cation channel subfamily M member 3 n=1 Tax=Rotaria sordida TaxID=392033 RepID=A0A813W4H4_9BILA|nr:unnamed protein product [Rotaria sordida]